MSWNIVLFLVVIVASNTIEAITGFAGTLLAMPPSIFLIGVDEAKVILNILSLVTCLYITIRNYKYINKKELAKMFLFMLIGLFLGIRLFDRFAIDILLKVYGFVILCIGLISLLKQGKEEKDYGEGIMIVILLLAGLIHGMFISGGSLLVVYATRKIKDKNEFRATLAPLWVGLNGIMLFSHFRSGFIDLEMIKLILISITPLLLGVFIGNKLHEITKEETFFKLTYILLIISGISLIF